jgi:hypothetical protein
MSSGCDQNVGDRATKGLSASPRPADNLKKDVAATGIPIDVKASLSLIKARLKERLCLSIADKAELQVSGKGHIRELVSNGDGKGGLWGFN